jgi:ubiquinone/menaquinone biosynthesis C-methylase UbiE
VLYQARPVLSSVRSQVALFVFTVRVRAVDRQNRQLVSRTVLFAESACCDLQCGYWVRRGPVPDFKHIYLNRAEQYEQLVSREDFQGAIPRALRQICSFDGLDIVELGAGTGRLTCLLAPMVKSIIACDISRPMLNVAAAKLRRLARASYQIVVADNRRLPLRDGIADVSIAGWSLGHATGWYPTTWRDEIECALTQLQRVVRLGGVMIILETLGTGYESPHPPTDALSAYYAMLEHEYGFASTWLRTDYRFDSVAEAGELTRFFFGNELADRVVRTASTILPECTGIWWRRR